MILAGKFRSLLTTFGDHSFRNFCELGKPMKSIRIRNSKLQFWILKLWILNFKKEHMVGRLRDTLPLLTSDGGSHCLPQNIWKNTNLENSKFNFVFKIQNSYFQICFRCFCFVSETVKRVRGNLPRAADLSRNDFSREMILLRKFREHFTKTQEMILSSEMILPVKW